MSNKACGACMAMNVLAAAFCFACRAPFDAAAPAERPRGGGPEPSPPDPTPPALAPADVPPVILMTKGSEVLRQFIDGAREAHTEIGRQLADVSAAAAAAKREIADVLEDTKVRLHSAILPPIAGIGEHAPELGTASTTPPASPDATPTEKHVVDPPSITTP